MVHLNLAFVHTSTGAFAEAETALYAALRLTAAEPDSLWAWAAHAELAILRADLDDLQGTAPPMIARTAGYSSASPGCTTSSFTHIALAEVRVSQEPVDITTAWSRFEAADQQLQEARLREAQLRLGIRRLTTPCVRDLGAHRAMDHPPPRPARRGRAHPPQR